MKRNFAEWIATVFFIGKLPFAPGTWASLIATLAWYFLFNDINIYILPLITFSLFILGIISSNIIIDDSKEHDPSRIVIDELDSFAQSNGAKGLAWFKVNDNDLEGGISKFFNSL